MPSSSPAPDFALLSAFDARTWSTVNVFRRGSNTVSLPTFATGDGVYEDAVSFLNGRGQVASKSLTDLCQSLKTFGTTWTVLLNSSDQINITCTDAAFTVTLVSGVDALGFGSSAVASVFGVLNVATAPNDWRRENMAPIVYKIDEVGGGGATFNLITTFTTQAPINTLRLQSRSDDDGGNSADNLTYLDTQAQSSNEAYWLLSDDGHVECRYATSIGGITWDSDTFRNRLGFSGSETPTTDAGVSTLRAEYPLPGALFPSRPYQSHHLEVETPAQIRRKTGGGYTRNLISSRPFVTSRLSFDLDALLDQKDLYQHFIHEFSQYALSGARVNFYQCWGDPRRSLQTASVSGSQSAYDLLFTSQDNGDYGRIRASATNSAVNLAYPDLRRKVPVNLDLEHV